MRYAYMRTIKLLLFAFLFQCLITESILESTLRRTNKVFPNLELRSAMREFNDARSGRLIVSNLDRLRGLMISLRRFTLSQVNINDLYNDNRKRGKMQPIISDDVEFPCNLTNTRSEFPPTSVNKLRPGDIDIISAMGDSLSAGNGILSSSILHTANEYRGLVFSGGGIETWRSILTLPNILKIFNPNLYGYSTGNGLVVDRSSRLNIAEPMLMSRDLPFQALMLVSRMRRDPNIDMERHWKLLTIFNGCNDLCTDMCHYESYSDFLWRHEQDLRSTFTILRDNIPRLLVNFLPAPNIVTTLYRMTNVPFLCQVVHAIGCSCIYDRRHNETVLQRIAEKIDLWQQTEKRIAALPEFQTDDFAVVYHPFFDNPPLRTLKNGETDYRYFSSDCFHFSQRGHAGLANSLWNSMLQRVGQKQLFISDAFNHFECPTEERPYIATIGNS